MSTELPSQSRVVVALGAAERGEYVIELARILAPSETPELVGVFVEDPELLAHAGSRQAREILLTGAERALERGSLERQLRSQATRARAAFEAASARFGLRHRFEVTRGDIFTESVKRAAAAEALVVGLAQSVNRGVSLTSLLRQPIGQRPPLVVLARQGWVSGQSVAVLVDDNAAAMEATLLAAARVAVHTGSPLTVLIPAAGAEAAGDVGERAAGTLRGYDCEVRNVIELGGEDVAAIMRAARACQARLLVMPAPTSDSASMVADELIRRFSGALMLVRP